MTLVEGDSFNLDVTIIPDDANDKSVIWFSNNTDIAVVDECGKVTGISKGSATIIVTANDGSGVSASCEVMVKERILGKCTAPTITYRNSKVELACEMEGGSMAQVCYVNKTPFCAIRSISDTADGDPEMAYVDFLEIAAKNSIALTLSFINKY